MKCPFCDYEDTKVIDTRPTEESSVIKRRRLCEKCNEKFITYERFEKLPPVIVIKSDMTRERFDKNKILKGIMLSCNKRPVSADKMNEILKEVEDTIANLNKKEINSSEIGEIIMELLKKTDKVAYIRFASVYRQFSDVDTFVKELTDLSEEG